MQTMFTNHLLSHLSNLKNVEIAKKYKLLEKSHKDMEKFITSYAIKHPHTIFMLSGNINDVAQNNIQYGGALVNPEYLKKISDLIEIFNKFKTIDIDTIKQSTQNLDKQIGLILENTKTHSLVTNKEVSNMLEKLKYDTIDILKTTKILAESTTPDKSGYHHVLNNIDHINYVDDIDDILNQVLDRNCSNFINSNKTSLAFASLPEEIAEKIKMSVTQYPNNLLLMQLNTLAVQLKTNKITSNEFAKQYNLIVQQEDTSNDFSYLDLPVKCFCGKFVKKLKYNMLLNAENTKQKINMIGQLLQQSESDKNNTDILPTTYMATQVIPKNSDNFNMYDQTVMYTLYLILIVTNQLYEYDYVIYEYIDKEILEFYINVIKLASFDVNNVNNVTNTDNSETINYLKKYHTLTLKKLLNFLGQINRQITLGQIIDINKCSEHVVDSFLLFNYFRPILHTYLYETQQKSISEVLIHKNIASNTKYSHLPTQLMIPSCLEFGNNTMLTTLGYSGSGKTFSLFGNSKNGENCVVQSILSNISNLQSVKFRMFELYGYQVGNNYKQQLFSHKVTLALDSLIYIQSNKHIDNHTIQYIENSDTFISIPIDTVDNMFDNFENFLKQVKQSQIESAMIKATPVTDLSTRSIMFYDFMLDIGTKNNVSLLIADTPSKEDMREIIHTYIDKYFDNVTTKKLFENGYSSKNTINILLNSSQHINCVKLMLITMLVCPILAPLFDPNIFIDNIATNNLTMINNNNKNILAVSLLQELFDLNNLDQIINIFKQMIDKHYNEFIKIGFDLTHKTNKNNSESTFDLFTYDFDITMYESLYFNGIINKLAQANKTNNRTININKPNIDEIKNRWLNINSTNLFDLVDISILENDINNIVNSFEWCSANTSNIDLLSTLTRNIHITNILSIKSN